MVATVNGHAPAATLPGHVVYRRRWVWIDYPAPVDDDAPEVDGADDRWRPNPAYHGFRVEVLANPSGAELREQEALIADLRAGTITEADYLKALAWRIRAWNALAEDDDGHVTPIPAPGETDDPNQWEALYTIDHELAVWVLTQVRLAHFFDRTRTRTRSTPASRPASAPETDA